MCIALTQPTSCSPNIFLTLNIPLSSISEDVVLSQPLAKVGDFGLSQFAYFEMISHKGKGVIGDINPRWTAPEVLRGQPYSVQSDVYSLGLLLWEVKYRKMAYGNVGEGPFQMEELTKGILSGIRPQVNVNDEYDKLCAECWADNPLNRPDAEEVVEKLLGIIQSLCPSLYKTVTANLKMEDEPPSSHMPKHSIPHTFKVSQSISVEDCRIVCSTFANSLLWFGCRNGKIGLYNTSDDSLLFVDEDISGTRCVVQCIQYIERSLSVWTGNNCGELKVWNASAVSGKMAAESVVWQGNVKRGWPLRMDGFMTLRYGTLTWRGEYFQDISHTIIQDILSITEINETSFSITTKKDKARYTCQDAKHIVLLIKRCQSYFTRPLVLTKRAERRIGINVDDSTVVPVISLAEIDGNAWSLDGQLMLTEWTIEVNHAGVIRGVLDLHPQRSLKMDGSVLKRDGCAAQPVGMWSICDSEVWVGYGNQFIRVRKNILLSSDELPLSQRDCIHNEWDQMPANVRANDLIILCGVVVNVSMNGRKEVEMWESTGLGVVFIWSVEEGVVKRAVDVGKIISAMVVVEDEVSLEMKLDEKRIIFFTFSLIAWPLIRFGVGAQQERFCGFTLGVGQYPRWRGIMSSW